MTEAAGSTPKRVERGPASGKEIAGDRAAILRAISHPVRHQILAVLTERDATPAELARATGRRRSDLARHLRVLRRYKAIEEVSPAVDRRAGPTYRAAVRAIVSDEEFGALPVETRRQIFSGILDEIAAHVRTSMAHGGFDRPDAHVSYTTMKLNHQAYEATVELLTETLERALAIGAASSESTDDAEERLESEIVLLHFLRTSGPPTRGGRQARALARMYVLQEEIEEEIPRRDPDWRRIAARAEELAGLARESAAASTARD